MSNKTEHLPLGGYFSLELPMKTKKHFHKKAICLNTGRNALEYILRTRPYVRHLLIPYYICDVVLEPLNKLGITYEFYNIGENLGCDVQKKYDKHIALLYVNYFGIKTDEAVRLNCMFGDSLILDNTQAFYMPEIPGLSSFNSARKFFGVSDGAYLYTNVELNVELEQDISWNRCTHLLKRLDTGPESGYMDFKAMDMALNNQPIKKMSNLTSAILAQIDYECVRQCRNENFTFLHQHLDSMNRLRINRKQINGPLAYPFWHKDGENIRNFLIENKVYVPTYWPNVVKYVSNDSLEFDLTLNLLALPIDQRYTSHDMQQIISLIKEVI